MVLRPLAFLLVVGLGGCSMANVPAEDTGTSSEPSTSGSSPASTGVDTVCGDGQRGGDEACDGADLAGLSCPDIHPAYVSGTLACADDCRGFDVSGCTLDPGAPLVALNEVTSKGVDVGTYAGLGDAIELFNAGDTPADLSGWKLSDDPTFPPDKTYVFPPGSTLARQGFLVLIERDDAAMTGDFPFGISSSGSETLTLADAGGRTIDALTLDGADAVLSLCRLPDGLGGWAACDPTFGAANTAQTGDCGDGVVQPGEACDGSDLGGQSCESLGFPDGALACAPDCTLDASTCGSDAAVAINEVESGEDRIELYNAGPQTLDLSGWILTDDDVAGYDPAVDTEKLVFPPGTQLAPQQFLVVTKGMGPGQHPFGLSAGGDQVSLLRPDRLVADQLSYGADEAVVSLCRLPDGPGGTPTAGCTPSFGAPNGP